MGHLQEKLKEDDVEEDKLNDINAVWFQWNRGPLPDDAKIAFQELKTILILTPVLAVLAKIEHLL